MAEAAEVGQVPALEQAEVGGVAHFPMLPLEQAVVAAVAHFLMSEVVVASRPMQIPGVLAVTQVVVRVGQLARQSKMTGTEIPKDRPAQMPTASPPSFPNARSCEHG